METIRDVTMTRSASSKARLPMSRTRVGLALLLHAFIVWGLCGMTMAVAMNLTSMPRALAVHAVAAPVFASMVSAVYYRRLSYTSPLATAAFIVTFIVLVDFFLVALVINRSLDMFRSVVGTWLPFGLIAATFVTGVLVGRCRRISQRPTLPDRRQVAAR